MTIFTNSTGSDTVRNAFMIHSKGVQRIALASPFFSYSSLINDICNDETIIDLLVRLGPATSANELSQLINRPNTHIRFFTSPKFHTKLYIFGDNAALVGSANLTQSGMQSNRELALTIDRGVEEFDELVGLFESYWAQANVLTKERLDKYRDICEANKGGNSEDSKFEKSLVKEFGNIVPAEGVQVDKTKVSLDKQYLEDYRRTYQKFISAFREVENIYESAGKRQHSTLPLRIEMDQFFSYVREEHGGGDKYKTAPIRSVEERNKHINSIINSWFKQRWEWLDDHIIKVYPKIQKGFGAPKAIEALEYENLIDILEICHAFHEQLRFHLGGESKLRAEFIRLNDIKKTKNTIMYLLHGKGDYVERMGTSIFDPEYKLAKFGRSVAQELLGWVNTENIPICNGRTLKALRYLGFDIRE